MWPKSSQPFALTPVDRLPLLWRLRRLRLRYRAPCDFLDSWLDQ
jgi:hypothetical protein